MARELRPGDLGRIIRSLGVAGDEFAQRAVEALAQQTERVAKENANTGSHRKGEPTTARKGAGPNVVTGNLRRNITHTRASRDSRGWSARAGVGPAARYGRIVEPNYPFLLPAADEVGARAASIATPLWRSPNGG